MRISVPSLSPDEMSDEDRHDYEEVLAFLARRVPAGATAPSGGEKPVSIGGYWGALLNSPGLTRRLTEMGRFYGQADARGSFSNHDRELSDLIVSRELRWNFTFKGHISEAFASGVTPETMYALLDGRHDDLASDDLQLLEFIRQVLTDRVTDEAFAGIVKRYGERGAVEFSAFIAHMLATSRLMHTLGVPDPTDEELRALVGELAESKQ